MPIELALNAEFMSAQPDREAAVFTYQKFALLQVVRRQRKQLRYDEETGRRVDEGRLDLLEALLEKSFPEFRRETARGPRWQDTWSGKTTRQLADISANRLRKDQYVLLFSSWSEQAHGSPGALADDMFGRNLEEVDRVVEEDDVRIAETLASAVTHFLELWALLPSIPQADPARGHAWLETLLRAARELGASA